ncbi:MAG TPA: hypothetical protein P5277_03835 [Candidatus Paceibacterota bacterium]|nr:hypothetical protein [Candidatus Paceibacterota bacterium]
MEYDLERREIKLNRVLSELDNLVFEFVKIIDKYADYVIMSGYVSILLGRSRTTEDIDLFIKPIDKATFSKLYNALDENGFWCINTDNENEVYSYLTSGLAVRFARKGFFIPNFEVKFPKDNLALGTYEDLIKVIHPIGILKISSLERHIAFKRYYLCSDKDIEDAQHIETIFKDKLDYNKINKLRAVLEKKRKNEQFKN